jgi:benzodiazapine receptor
MLRNNPYKWWNLISFLAMLVVNGLANTTLLGGRRTGEISEMYPTYLTPAGYAFSIWLVIYILLAGFICYQFSRGKEGRESVQNIGIWFTISCVINISWLLLWQYLYIELSVVAMIFLLLTLIVLYRRSSRIPFPTTLEYWFVKLPFSLYLSWISVATILNVAVALTKNDWGGFGLQERTWAVIMLFVGSVLAILVSYPYRDSTFPLVFVWAYIAIAMKQKEVEHVFLAACILSGILFIYSLWLFFVRNRDRD